MRGNNRGVAPVVATILLVAIAVILAATVATFVLDLTERTGDPAPTVTFEIEQTDTRTVLARHAGGQTLDRANLAVRGGQIVDTELPQRVRAGDPVEIDPAPEVDEVTLVWQSERNSAVLANILPDVTTPFVLNGEPLTLDQLEDTELDLGPGEEIEFVVNQATCLTITGEQASSQGSIGPLFGSIEADRSFEAGAYTIENSGGEQVTVSFESLDREDTEETLEDGDTITFS